MRFLVTLIFYIFLLIPAFSQEPQQNQIPAVGIPCILIPKEAVDKNTNHFPLIFKGIISLKNQIYTEIYAKDSDFIQFLFNSDKVCMIFKGKEGTFQKENNPQ